MKLLIALYRYHYWGGLQSDTLRLATEALSRGHQVTVFTTSWPEPPPGLAVEVVPPRGLTNTARMRNYNRAWRQRLEQHDYDVAVAMDRVEGADFYFAADSCMKAYYRRKYPAWWLAISPRHRAILEMERRVCGAGSPTRVWYIAPMQRVEFAAEYGTPPERLLELPPGMRPECLRPAEEEAQRIRAQVRQELGLGADQVAVIQIGSNLIRKGTDRLLRGLGALAPEERGRLRLVLVGANDDYAVHKMACRAGFPPEHVVATGPRRDVGRLLLGAELMVHPAREEGTGTVLVEALAAGIPVVCTGCCGFSPIVAAAGGIALDEPYDPAALPKALHDMLSALPEYTRKAREYGATHDFTSRQRVMVDMLEQLARERAQ